MWKSDEFEFIEFSIRGRQYDAKMFKIHSIKPPTIEAPYWEIEYEDGVQMVSDSVVTILLAKRDRTD